MDDIYTALSRLGVIPVIKLEDPDSAEQLGRALIDGMLPIAEVTFRTASAAESIKRLRKKVPELLVGAGTVLTLEQAKAAVEAGAQFAVTPGFNPRIVDYFRATGIPVIPGVNSPTQVEMGLEHGLQLLKFFPAEASGGTRMLKALFGPYSAVKFVPTGGIDAGNLPDYLRLPNVAACGGSWMVKEESI
ncbi:MAG: bifunctional 4-hydroxy-2-oxoglutarate aldolase/2-dehydro-3-deoxy-phosphogluconate aldolase [Spirochaetia bacterium]|jgi:2-dehydro-3-deoxyphosphogluconate aldolase/(4S)-4-hydroxy-2-oxoglutarate aldolase|nr:bifunctional 4-hydroxy-2-oxoglutarate aldolase/2-dehydro-3-deoxy-phosphogluconate aldolase [Spirochaetia bacterium]